VALTALLAVVVAGGQSVPAFGAPSTVPSRSHDKRESIKAEQSDADSTAEELGLASGEGLVYRGNGLGGFSGAVTRIGGGWGGFGALFSPGDLTGDGRPDVLAVKANGDLYLYRGNGLGGFTGPGTLIAPA